MNWFWTALGLRPQEPEHTISPPKSPLSARKFGLNQVYPDLGDSKATFEANIDIIALHGLDAQSPTTWLAWEREDDPKSESVHWLRDSDMLPSVLNDSRILTYDWNANYDETASSDKFIGHADALLDRIYVDRANTKRLERPIIFIASCFGGLLLAKALVRATDQFVQRHQKYREILHATVGVAFLGTPFYGSWKAGYTAAQLRIAVAIETSREHSQELPQYLQSDNSSLDECVQRFCEMVSHDATKFPVVCFYETRHTNFSAIRRKLPDGYAREQLDENGHGIAVDRHSACLQVAERVPLDVRHNMLHKYNSPENDIFRRLSSRLKDFADDATKVIARKGEI